MLEYGDRDAADAGLILRSTVGSGVHGIAITGTDDHDEMAVFVEPPAWALGLAAHRSSYIARSQPEGARSGPGDTDLVAYTLRKYLRLAVKGNPTALLPLFAPETRRPDDDGRWATSCAASRRRSCPARRPAGSWASCAASASGWSPAGTPRTARSWWSGTGTT